MEQKLSQRKSTAEQLQARSCPKGNRRQKAVHAKRRAVQTGTGAAVACQHRPHVFDRRAHGASGRPKRARAGQRAQRLDEDAVAAATL